MKKRAAISVQPSYISLCMGLKNNIQGKRSLLMISSITLGIFLLARCVDKDNHAAQTARPPGFTAFAGSASCTGCQKTHTKNTCTAHIILPRESLLKKT